MGLYRYLIERLIFFPEKVLEFVPRKEELPYKDIFFKSTDGTILHGWFFPWEGTMGGIRTLIYFHGNAGNIGDRIEKMKMLRKIGLNIFIFDYREYGGSEGKASIEGVYKDAAAAFKYVASRPDVNPHHIILYGTSLGSALAVDIAGREFVSALILESAFTSLKDVAKAVYPFIPSFLVPNEMRAINSIGKIRAPLLSIHGTEDEIIPIKLGKKLWDAAPQPKRFYPVPGGHHNDVHLVGGDTYLNEMTGFLREVGN